MHLLGSRQDCQLCDNLARFQLARSARPEADHEGQCRSRTDRCDGVNDRCRTGRHVSGLVDKL